MGGTDKIKIIVEGGVMCRFDDFFDRVIVVIIFIGLFVLGFVWGSDINEIKSGHPIVIDNKVYRCSERSE